MIRPQRSANLSYGTDSVAQSLRSVLAAAPAVRIESDPVNAPGKAGAIDLTALYPAIFAPQARSPFMTRTARALAFRLTVFGTAAAAMVLIHHSF